jgi:membrane protease YdiL (CAAX protease family)
VDASRPVGPRYRPRRSLSWRLDQDDRQPSIGSLHWFDIIFGLGVDTYTEEVVFRRCARHEFKPYLGDGLLLVAVTSLLFGAYHWWSGVGNILAVMLMGVLFMLFFRRSGSLWPVVLSHYLTDVAHFA